MNTRILLLPCLLILSSCATTYKDFKTTDVNPDEGVAIGRVNIRYNGKNMNKDCVVCLNSTNGPCQNLTEEGIVFRDIPRGKNTISRIACKDVSIQHYNVSGATFNVGEGVNYFGQVNIDWSNKGGFKPSTMFGLVGAMIDESSNDGKIKMSVSEGNLNELKRIYEAQAKQPVRVSTNLVKAGK